MLDELKRAHAQLLEGIAELAELTREERPDTGRLAQVRWRLSRASGQRRRIVDQACAHLLERGSPEQIQRVRELRENSAGMLATSSRHIGIWTIDQVSADWEGYRAASSTMRHGMRARIATEQSTLYPLLEANP